MRGVFLSAFFRLPELIFAGKLCKVASDFSIPQETAMTPSSPTLETALAHRSIRKFTDQAIDDDLLKTLIGAGQMASTSSFLQNVSVIRVRDKAKRAQIREICANAYQGKLGHHYVENCAEFLVFCADARRHQHFAPEAQIDWIEVLMTGAVDVGIMAQNVLLAAESVGLGGVFIGSLRNDLPALSRILGIPHGVVPVVGMCLGYPNQEPGQRPRLPVDTVLMDNGYQDADDAVLAQYDAVVKDYYKNRSNLDLSWGDQIRNNLNGEIRPTLLAYLQQQGFAKR